MGKQRANCWEVMGCGREPGGNKCTTQGVCPAANTVDYDGVNAGQRGGRFCWAVAGTLCGGEIQGTFAEKAFGCMNCDFYAMVVHEQGVSAVVINPSQLR